MRRKNTKAAEIVLLIAVILFIIFTALTYKNLAEFSQGMENTVTTESVTEAGAN